MTELPRGSVTLKIVSRRTNLCSKRSDDSPTTRPCSWPPIAEKARRLHEVSQGAAAIVETVIDDVLAKFATRPR